MGVVSHHSGIRNLPHKYIIDCNIGETVMVTNRESYYDYMLRRYREDRAKNAPSLEEKVDDIKQRYKELLKRVEQLESTHKPEK